MRKYLAFFTTSFKQSLANRWSIAGRFLFYGIILFVFSRLWSVVESRGDLPIPSSDLVWYLAMTEWIVLSVPFISRDIEQDVRSGNLAYQLGRPISYLWSQYSTALGAHLTRMLFLSFAGFFFAFAFSGGLPSKPLGLLLFIPLAVFSSLLALIFHCLVGLTSFWVQDSFPLYLIYQKFTFILGGMMLPLDIYPAWLRNLAEWSPFPMLLYAPTKAALTLDFNEIPIILVKTTFWIILVGLLTELVFRQACRGLNLNGG